MTKAFFDDNDAILNEFNAILENTKNDHRLSDLSEWLFRQTHHQLNDPQRMKHRLTFINMLLYNMDTRYAVNSLVDVANEDEIALFAQCINAFSQYLCKKTEELKIPITDHFMVQFVSNASEKLFDAMLAQMSTEDIQDLWAGRGHYATSTESLGNLFALSFMYKETKYERLASFKKLLSFGVDPYFVNDFAISKNPFICRIRSECIQNMSEMDPSISPFSNKLSSQQIAEYIFSNRNNDEIIKSKELLNDLPDARKQEIFSAVLSLHDYMCISRGHESFRWIEQLFSLKINSIIDNDPDRIFKVAKTALFKPIFDAKKRKILIDKINNCFSHNNKLTSKHQDALVYCFLENDQLSIKGHRVSADHLVNFICNENHSFGQFIQLFHNLVLVTNDLILKDATNEERQLTEDIFTHKKTPSLHQASH